jgi:mono/diheme cytochrome c family protein
MPPRITGACTWIVSIVLLPISLAAQGGPTDRPALDEAAASRGRGLYAQHCINCHGSTAKGGPNGPDLIRSPAVLGSAPASGRRCARRRLRTPRR